MRKQENSSQNEIGKSIRTLLNDYLKHMNRHLKEIDSLLPKSLDRIDGDNSKYRINVSHTSFLKGRKKYKSFIKDLNEKEILRGYISEEDKQRFQRRYDKIDRQYQELADRIKA